MLLLMVEETKSRHGRFDGWIDGDKIVTSSRTPFLRAARVLMQRGMDPATILTMVHKGTGTRSLSGPIGQAAKLIVNEMRGAPRFRPYTVPTEGGASGPVDAQDDENATDDAGQALGQPPAK